MVVDGDYEQEESSKDSDSPQKFSHEFISFQHGLSDQAGISNDKVDVEFTDTHQGPPKLIQVSSHHEQGQMAFNGGFFRGARDDDDYDDTQNQNLDQDYHSNDDNDDNLEGDIDMMEIDEEMIKK